MTKVHWSGVSYDVLTVICEYSRFLVARVVPSESASDLWAALKSVFDTYGYPEYVRSDRGTGYVALQAMFTKYGSRGLLCVAERPTANACVERVHRSIKNRIRALASVGESIGVRKAIEVAVRAYNFTPHSSLDLRSPVASFFGRDVRVGLEAAPAEPVCPYPNVFAVGEQVWVRRPDGKRGRGESTFLPDRYVVLTCKGRSVTLKPLLSDDKRRIVTVASDRVARCKSIVNDAGVEAGEGIDVSDASSELDGVSLLDLARGLFDQDVVDGPVHQPVGQQGGVAREARPRRAPARFGIDEFVYP